MKGRTPQHLTRLIQRLKAWWLWKRWKTVALPGFYQPEKLCIYCDERFEILAAEINPQYARPRLLVGCRSCRSRGVYNSIWVEV